MKKIIFVTILFLIAIPLLSQAHGDEGDHHLIMEEIMKGGENSMMGFSSMSLGGGGMWLGWIWMILFWGLVILAIVALVRWLTNQGRSEAKGKTALDIIQERYARGEINKKEFEEKKKDLS